jgi:hypothetical protein
LIQSVAPLLVGATLSGGVGYAYGLGPTFVVPGTALSIYGIAATGRAIRHTRAPKSPAGLARGG